MVIKLILGIAMIFCVGLGFLIGWCSKAARGNAKPRSDYPRDNSSIGPNL